MGTGFLIDTNTIIDFSANKFNGDTRTKIAQIIDESPTISIITKIELLSYGDVSNQILFFVREALILPLSNEIVEKTIELRKNYRVKVPDAIIAATAILSNLTLITHNMRDFNNIKKLKLIDSYLVTLKVI